eukprot:923840-Pelagomonas_calceolata.AAC.1
MGKLTAERSKHNFDRELQGLESSVRAVEQSVRELRAHLVSESATIPKGIGSSQPRSDCGEPEFESKVEAIIAASSLQGDDLNTINSHLPPHLPGLQSQTLGMSVLDAVALLWKSACSAVRKGSKDRHLPP